MENQPHNDENSIIGKKRQQTQSPYTAATPKSRIGKEPKRLFGPSPLTNFVNAADPNLDETAIESRPCSAVPSEMSDCVDPNLEQTELISEDDISNTFTAKDLSMVSEGDETEADVTLADTFEEKVQIDVEKTPTKSSSGPTNDLSTSSVVSAPTSVVSQIHKGIDSWADDSYASPVYQQKAQIDQSLHEFMLLEREVEHSCDVRELRAQVIEFERKIKEINESRVFEEQALMQQTDSVTKKAKADRAAAKQREEQLETEIAELRAKLGEHSSNDLEKGDEKAQLEQQLAQLTAQIEELTMKALSVEEMQKGIAVYEERIQALQDEKLANRQALEALEAELQKVLSQTEEQKSESEEMRKMMLNDMKNLEDQLEHLSQKPSEENEEVQKLRDQVAQLEDSLQTRSQQMEELKVQLEEAAKKTESVEADTTEKEKEVEKLKEEIATMSSSSAQNVLAAEAEHTQELEELQKKMEAEIAALKTQLDAVNTEELEKTIDELTTALLETQKDSETKVQELNAEIMHTRQESADLQKTMEMKYETEIFDLSNIIASLRTELEAARQQLHAEPSVDSLVDAQLLESVRNQLKSTETELLEARENTEKVKKESEEELETVRKIMMEALDEAEKQVAELKVQAENTAKVEDAQKALEIAESKIQEMAVQLEVSRQETEIQKQKVVDAEATEVKCQELQTELEIALKTFENIQQAQAESVTKISQLEALIQDTEAAKLEVQVVVDGLREDLVNAGLKQNEEVEAKIQELQEKLALSETKADEMQTQRDAAIADNEVIEKQKETELEAAEEKVREVQLQLDVARQATEDLQKSNEQAQFDSEEQTSKIADLEAQLRETLANVVDVKQELEKAHAHVQELSATTEALQSDTSNKDELVVAEAKIRELGETIQQQTMTIETLRDEAKSFRITSDERISELQQAISDATAEVQTVREELNEVQQSSAVELATAHDIQKQFAAEIEEGKVQLESMLAAQATSHSEQLTELATEKEALSVEISELQSQLSSAQKEVLEIRADDKDIEALNVRLIELETSIAATKAELAEVDQIRVAKEAELNNMRQKVVEVESQKNQIEETVGDLRVKNDALQAELAMNQKQKEMLDESRQVVAELTEKLEVAEQAVSEKENAVVILESRIETLSIQFEQRLTEAGAWKTQAMGMEALNTTVAQMASQLKEMSARLEASNRRVVEVEETAQHDVTLMREEVDGHVAELEMARARIAELEEKLAKAEKEIKRLEEVCDEFDEDEAKLKQKVYDLEDQIKKLKGVQPAAPAMGLLQQARLGIKPLSRESSRVEEQPEKDDFEDASDSFMPKQSVTMNLTARHSESPNVTTNISTARASTTMHPDDMADTSLAAETPSKKKANRSNCQQQ